MPECTLRGCRIMIVEDEYMLADQLWTELSNGEAIVLGPAGTLDQALDLINSERHIDCVVLDVNIGGDMAYPAADLLLERKVPFVFTTGYDDSVIPSRFASVVRCAKPFTFRLITQAIARSIHD